MAVPSAGQYPTSFSASRGASAEACEWPRAAEAAQGSRWSYRLLFGWLALGVALGAACLLYQSLRDLHLAADITTPDSVLVQSALWARQSGHLYRAWSAPPYTPTPYGPLYYWALIGLSVLTGPRFEALLVAGRVFTFACFLGVAALAYLWSRRLGLGRMLALLAAGLVLSEAGFAHWSITTRPDVAALACSFAAVYLAAGREGGANQLASADGAARGAGRRAVAIGLLLAASLLFKQSYWAAPLAIGFWLVARRDGQSALRIIATGAATVSVVLGALLLRGDAVLANLLALRHAMPHFATGIGIVIRTLEDYVPHGLLFALAMVGLGAAITLPYPRPAATAGRRARMPAAKLLALYCALSWVIGIATLAANSGGGDNYLLEGWATTAVLAAYGLARLEESWPATPPVARTLLVVWVALSYGAGVVGWHHRAFTETPVDEAALGHALRGHPVLSDIPYLALQGRNPEYLDLYLLRTLEVRGRWRSTELVRAVATQHFDAIVMDDGTGSVNTVWRGLSHFDAATMSAIQQSYRPLCSAFPAVVYLPARLLAKPAEATWIQQLEGAGCRRLGLLRVHRAVP